MVGFLYPWGDVEGVEVGLYDGDAVVVDTVFGVGAYLARISVDGHLEDVAEVAAHVVYVLVDDDDGGITVFTEHVAEEAVDGGEGIAEEEDAPGTEHELVCLVPCGDIVSGDDGLQLHGRQERGDGYRLALVVEAYLGGQPAAEEFGQADVCDVVETEVVLVFDIHITE